MEKNYRFTVLLERAEEGGYTVSCPALQGCVTEGDTLEEALAMIQDAMKLHIEARLADGESIPDESGVLQVNVSV